MRGATCVIVQTHQILRLPRKMNLMIDPCHTWNVIYNARSNKCHCPNSPNTAPATKNDRPNSQRNLLKTDETSFPMRGRSEHDPTMIRPWSEHETVSPQPASQPRLPFTPTTSILYWKIQHFALRLSYQISPNTAPATKSDTWTSPNTAPATKSNTHHCMILFTHETLFTIRGVTSVIVLTHQILRLPRKMNLMIDPWHKWNVIYNARSNMRHSPNSPNILRLPRKMTVQNLKEICWKRMKRHFQCAADPTMIREWSDHDPTMIRAWNRQSATRLATEVTFHAHHEHFVLKNTTFRAPAIIPNFTEYCACHEKWHLNFTKYCACHEKWTAWLILVTHETLFPMRGVTSVIVQTHQILRLPRKMNLMIDPSLSYDLTELLLNWAMTWLSYYLTELWLHWAMTWLSYDLTELWLHWAMTWLSYDLTELWLDWAMTWLSYDLTWLDYDLTELWLDWAMTWHDLTELWLDMTWLWLDWAMTWLSYDLTWLDWAMTWLS